MDLRDLQHIAIIMDGNGRWAQSRGLKRTRGHRAGVSSVRNCVTECARAGLPWLTLFALSTENYLRRPRLEVHTLMALLRRFMIRERPTFMENGVRLKTIGLVDDLPPRVVAEIRKTEALTRNNNGMTLTLALNYGGRREIVESVKRLVHQVIAGSVELDDLTEADFAANLDSPDMPDVDLLIRTAGEFRLSNFLLWQVSYGELHVTETCWPDFGTADLEEAVASYRRRTRRFGGLISEAKP